MASDTDDEPFSHGAIFGSYQIQERIGRGGMASVWRAVHLTLRKPVAIKVLRVQAARERFLREGEVMSRIRHAHVVDVHDVGFVGEVPYLVMELLEGEDLRELFHRRGALPLGELSDLMVPVCAAVATAHDAGVVHRDLKPGNIFLSYTRDQGVVPKVLDFGLSRQLDAPGDRTQTRTSVILGTPRYMAPEQVRGARHADARSDQYALGVILYRGAVGVLPFDDTESFELMRRVVRGAFDPPRAVRPDLPEAFESVILRAMATSADDRFASVRALGAALLPFASERTRILHGPSLLGAPVVAAPRVAPSSDPSQSTLPSAPKALLDEPSPTSVTLGGAPIELPSSVSDARAKSFRTRAIATVITVALSLFTMWAMTPSAPDAPPPRATAAVLTSVPVLSAPTTAPLPVAPLAMPAVAPVVVSTVVPAGPVVNVLRGDPPAVQADAAVAPTVPEPARTTRPVGVRRPRGVGGVNAHDID